MCDPEKFIYDHFPVEKSWQLLDRTWSLKKFDEMPFLNSRFFYYNLKLLNNSENNVINCDENG